MAAALSQTRLTTGRIVACARIGQQRVVKLRLDGRDAVLTLVVRWVPRADGWRAQTLDVARLDAARPA